MQCVCCCWGKTRHHTVCVCGGGRPSTMQCVCEGGYGEAGMWVWGRNDKDSSQAGMGWGLLP